MQLRIALTISGAVSLGAYEGGAIAALFGAVRELSEGDDPLVRVDAIGGASAGSITGMLAARCLLEGIDPVYVMREAWVRRDSLGAMRSRGSDAPLSVASLRDAAVALLDPRDASNSPLHRVETRQRVPVRVVMALAALRGLEYRIPTLSGRAPAEATTSLDWALFQFEPGQPVREFVEPPGASPVDVALASAANPLGFSPRILDRARDEQIYRDNGIVNFPGSRQLWYTDGGTLDNEPLGRTIELVGDLDRTGPPDLRRVHLLVHPNPTGAPKDDAWADPSNPPTWIETLRRVWHLFTEQTIYDDVRRLEKVNSRIRWAETLFSELRPALGALDRDQAERIRAALGRALEVIEGDRAALRNARRASSSAHAQAPVDASRPLTDLLRDAVSRIAGITGKEPVALEVISPMALAEAKTTPVSSMLAGEFLFHFGGFLDEELRESDFDLGYRSTLEWLRNGALSAYGLPTDAEARALAAAEAAYQPHDRWRTEGTKGFGDLEHSEQLAVLPFIAQVGRVVVHDLRTGGTQ